uniref:Uncharacterized protein n=1 Tax=Meloidogyne enterolobii TaxID=390850 RepID=A0A6V7U8I3_MELEN|nr:unnamed protein product [Meloidogyne enterolobii]
MLKRPELVQHKMYLNFQPAAYFCLWKTIHERALDWRNQNEFKATAYSELPTVKHFREGDEHFMIMSAFYLCGDLTNLNLFLYFINYNFNYK